MLPSTLRLAARCALFSSLGWCTACGASGLDWVAEGPVVSIAQPHAHEVEASSVARVMPGSIPASTEQSANEPRPRLNHTVTLGEIDVVTAPTEASNGAAGPSVIVNNYNQVNLATPAFGYGYYGYARPPAGFSPGRVAPYPSRASASGPLPGQNWPAVADLSSSFP